MLLFALLATAAPPDHPAPMVHPAALQARATVHIVAGARITPRERPHEALVRLVEIRNADGSAHTGQLIEFP